MTVEKNISYPLRIKKIRKRTVDARVAALAEEINIGHLLHRMPGNLSGGELQRVAIARTLIDEPRCLLLDEPLSSIDVQLKEDIRGLLRTLNRRGITMLHVTHDFYEAFSLAEHIAVLDQGRIVRQGTPDEIFRQPGSRFIAGFIGIKNHFRFQKSSAAAIILQHELALEGLQPAMEEGFVVFPQSAISLGTDPDSRYSIKIPGTVTRTVLLPANSEIIVQVEKGLTFSVIAESGSAEQYQSGQPVWINIDPAKALFLDA